MSSNLYQVLKRNPSFRNLTTGLGISLIGDWFNLLAVYALLVELTGASASSVGYVLVIKQLPLVFVAPLSGIVADRFSRRQTMIISDLVRSVIVFGLLASPYFNSVGYIYGLLTLQTIFSSFFEPARSAIVPSLVEDKDLLSANTISGMLWSSGLIIGSLLGGVATELFGWRWAIGFDAVTYLISAYFISKIKFDESARIQSLRSNRSSAGLGQFFGYLKDRPRVLACALVKFGYGWGGAMYLILTVFGQQVFALGNRGVLGVTVLYMARGVGALLGPIVARRFVGQERAKIRRGIFYAFVVTGLAYSSFGLCQNLYIGCFFVLLAHMGGSVVWVFSNFLIQMEVEDIYRGRTFGFDLAAFTVTSSVSTLIYGYALDHGIVSPAEASIILGLMWLPPALLWVWAQRLWRNGQTAEYSKQGGE